MVTRTSLGVTLYVHCFVGCGLNFSGLEQGPATRFEDDDEILTAKETASRFSRRTLL